MQTIGIPVYEGVDLLDVMGPYEMFGWAQGLECRIVSQDGGPVTSHNGVRFETHASFANAPFFDALWVPGGNPRVLGPMMSDHDSPYLAYLRLIAESAIWVCSVCEGALLAARAGLLDGHQVTTHWRFAACLDAFPAVELAPGHPRYVLSGNRLTGGGISSGLDEALKLIELMTGEDNARQVQLTTQYYPDPPVSSTIPDDPGTCPVHWTG